MGPDFWYPPPGQPLSGAQRFVLILWRSRVYQRYLRTAAYKRWKHIRWSCVTPWGSALWDWLGLPRVRIERPRFPWRSGNWRF